MAIAVHLAYLFYFVNPAILGVLRVKVSIT
jgi:hypothetical protein